MDVKTEKAFVVRMNAEEAGVMLSLLGMISGPCDALGRTVTNAMRSALEDAGAIPIDAFDGDTEIAAKDVGSNTEVKPTRGRARRGRDDSRRPPGGEREDLRHPH